MSLRLLHTADIHLGIPLIFLGDKSSSHKRLMIDALNRVIDIAVKEKVDAVLICGDIFDTESPSVYNVEIVKKALERLSRSNIHSIIIPGNHDHNPRYSNLFPKDPLIHIITNGNIYIEELSTVFYGYTLKDGQGLKVEDDEHGGAKYRVGLIHGSIDIGKGGNKRQVGVNELKELGLDYIALGDWHGVLELAPNIYYSGSPEVMQSGQGNAGFILDVILTDKELKVEKRRTGTIEIFELPVDVGRFKNIGEILEYISKYKDEKRIINIKFEGSLGAGMILDELQMREYLSDMFYFINILNRTTFSLSKEELLELSSGFIIGHYVSYLGSLRGKVDDELLNKALALGVNRLLQSER